MRRHIIITALGGLAFIAVCGAFVLRAKASRPAMTVREYNQTLAAPATGPSSKSGVTEITMTDDDAFKPAQVTIRAGATVRWKNASKDEHTVTDDPKVASNAKDVSSPAGAKPFNSGKIKPGGTFEQKFTIPGTYQYVCEPHEDMDMKGKVIVTAAGSSAPSGPGH